MRFDKEISKDESIANNPTENGWYVCSVLRSSVTFYADEAETEYIYPRPVDYDIANYEPRLLYWESNVWITHPRSYQTVDEKDIISWTKAPDDYFQTVKIKY